jgi:hypothetical protein
MTKRQCFYSYYIAIALAFLVRLIWISLIPVLSNAPDESSHWRAVEYLSEYFRQPSSQEIIMAQVGAHIIQIQTSYFHMVIPKMVFDFLGVNESSLIYVCRISNTVLSLVAVINCKYIFERLLGEKKIAYLLSIALAFHPQYLFISSYINNDIFACWITTLSIIVLLEILSIYFSNLENLKDTKKIFQRLIYLNLLLGFTVFCSLFSKSSSLIIYVAAFIILLVIFVSSACRIEKPWSTTLDYVKKPKFKFNIISLLAALLLGFSLYYVYMLKLSIPNLSASNIFSASFIAQVIVYPRYPQFPRGLYTTIFSSHSFWDYLKTITQMEYWKLIFQGFWGIFDNMSLKMHGLWYYFYFPYMISFFYGYLNVFRNRFKFNWITTIEYIMCLGIVLMCAGSLSFSYQVDFQAQGRHFLPVLVIVYYFIAKGLHIFRGFNFTRLFILTMIVGSVICTLLYVPLNLFSIYYTQ